MGLADAVPGVSGGTMALICGFYERLLSSAQAIIQLVGNPFSQERRHAAGRALWFLIPLGAGAVVMLLAATRLLVGKDAPKARHMEGLTTDQVWQVALQPPGGILLDPSTGSFVYALFFRSCCRVCS